jgi:hypothetical protein
MVRTTREWSRDKDSKLVEASGFRQFENHHAYMTPSEAAFIIDSNENHAHIDAGLPPMYYYPAGAPFIVDENKDGPLSPPLGSQALVSNNPQQAEAARRVVAEAEEQIALRDAETQDRVNAKRSQAQATKIEAPADVPQDEDKSQVTFSPMARSGAAPMKISNPDFPD